MGVKRCLDVLAVIAISLGPLLVSVVTLIVHGSPSITNTLIVVPLTIMCCCVAFVLSRHRRQGGSDDSSPAGGADTQVSLQCAQEEVTHSESLVPNAQSCTNDTPCKVERKIGNTYLIRPCSNLKIATGTCHKAYDKFTTSFLLYLVVTVNGAW